MVNTSGTPGRGRGVTFGRRASRVRGVPEHFGELPLVCLAEEIETPGDGRVRALITIAGNPGSSAPDSARLDRAFASLDFMVSVDIYVNETTRHANVILPPEPELARGHYDLALYSLAIRNIANYSPPLIDLAPGEVPEWHTLLRLGGVLQGLGPHAEVDALDDFVITSLVHKAVAPRDRTSKGAMRTSCCACSTRVGARSVCSISCFAPAPTATASARTPAACRSPCSRRRPTASISDRSNRVCPKCCVRLRERSSSYRRCAREDVARLRNALERRVTPGALLLVGRRDLRSNNSWMHNIDVLVKGKPRCTVHVHPDDACRLGVTDGADVCVRSRSGAIVLAAEVTDAVMPGVVSIPHGWGHGADGIQLRTAAAQPGANTNVLARTDMFDPLSGNAVLNGIPVELVPA